MKTFEDILFRLEGKLKKYICYCNSEQNLGLVRDDVDFFLQALQKQGKIKTHGMLCDKNNNPNVNHTTIQYIRIGIRVTMSDGTTHHALVTINTKTVDCFVKLKFTIHPDQIPHDVKKKSSTDAYDRAMGIVK